MNTKELLALLMVKGIGSAYIKKNIVNIMQFDTALDYIAKFKAEQVAAMTDYYMEADKIIADCKDNAIRMLSILDAEYPRVLLEISDPPTVLYMKGNFSLVNNAIAIIGTRKSSDFGNRIAWKLGTFFSNYYAICNGLVEGIDESSIYNCGHMIPNVIGVISGGLCYEETCSTKHVSTIKDVLSNGGLIISEFPPRYKEDRYSGSKASRIQAGLSRALILVESSIRGGSKYTLESFAKLNRPLGVISLENYMEFQQESFGANRLISQKRERGLLELLHLKKQSALSVGEIVPITGKDDYPYFMSLVDKNSMVAEPPSLFR